MTEPQWVVERTQFRTELQRLDARVRELEDAVLELLTAAPAGVTPEQDPDRVAADRLAAIRARAAGEDVPWLLEQLDAADRKLAVVENTINAAMSRYSEKGDIGCALRDLREDLGFEPSPASSRESP